MRRIELDAAERREVLEVLRSALAYGKNRDDYGFRAHTLEKAIEFLEGDEPWDSAKRKAP